MAFEKFQWLLKMSASVYEDEELGGGLLARIRELKVRSKFMAKAAMLLDSLQPYMHPAEGSPFQRALQQRPILVGAVIWPYICATWEGQTRLRQIEAHFSVMRNMPCALAFSCNEKLQLLDLAEDFSGLQIVLDQPGWFMREGLLVINLFIQDVRIYSLAFSFAYEEGKVIAYVGAIQGVDVEGITDNYKDLTKALHGMRPRDFLFEVFRTFCRAVGVTRIYAVSDDKRQHRSRYFGSSKSEELFINYNTIWQERGGVQDSEDFFLLSMDMPMKNLEEISSKKRAMYRRRYEFMLALDARMHDLFKDSAFRELAA